MLSCFEIHHCAKLTKGRTDRQTDRQSVIIVIAPIALHVATCSKKVKIQYKA